MNQLRAEVVRKPCAFVLQIEINRDTLRQAVMFFEDRHIEIDNLQYHGPGNGSANLIIHYQVEKDRIARTVHLLERMPGMEQVARSIAEHWHTKQKENISWQYLYNSMSTVEMGTIRSLEDKLVGLVNWLRKMKRG